MSMVRNLYARLEYRCHKAEGAEVIALLQD